MHQNKHHLLDIHDHFCRAHDILCSGGLQPSQPAIQLIHDALGYPVYFIPLISYAKLIGVL
jgi:hypothetical protein